MKITKTMILDQNSDEMEDLATKNMTTTGICGFITCAAVVHLSRHGFHLPITQHINQKVLTPLIQDAMTKILQRRRLEIKKFKIINDHERKAYLKDYVANFEIVDYLENCIDDLPNKQIYFFRQAPYDHQELVNHIKYEEAYRTEMEEK
jgi:hypothetical protein